MKYIETTEHHDIVFCDTAFSKTLYWFVMYSLHAESVAQIAQHITSI